MPIKNPKELCHKMTTVYREHKKPLLLLLAIGVLTGVAERFGENLFQKEKQNPRATTQNFYMNNSSEENQKITCPFCHKEIQFNYITTHTANPLPNQNLPREKE